METPDNSGYVTPGPEREMVLNQEALYYLQQAGKWATFLGIVGFIFTGLILLGALSASALVAVFQRINPMIGAGMAGGIAVYYIVIAAVYFFFSLYLYQFGSKVKQGIGFGDTVLVTAALGKLKSFFKLWGIMTIVAFALMVVIIICAIIFAATFASAMHTPATY
jgi:hypothetical protein